MTHARGRAAVPTPIADIAEQDFAGLEADLPLLLLPVRVDTRYQLHTDPPALRIRILPDRVHVANDSAAPGKTEADLTAQFWRSWYATESKAKRQALWRRLVRRLGAPRAAYLARLLRPQVSTDGKLIAPSLGGPDDGPAADGPQLLPSRWIAVGYRAGEVVFQRASRPVRRGLRIGPDPAAASWEAGDSGLRVDEGMAWLVDYDRAIEVGMAITVPLEGHAAAALDGLDTLLVVGVLAGDASGAAEQLEQLLRAHARSDGLAFVPQGTPTNNTEAATSGWSRVDSELEDLAARELEPPPSTPGTNAARFAEALGLDGETTLRRVAFGTGKERQRSRAMVRVTFEALLGTMMRQLLKVGDAAGVRPSTVKQVRDWCIDNVTGGAHYPCLRIGSQPYGLLPVLRSGGGGEPGSTAAHIERVVELLAGQWRRAADGLPVLDHNRGESATDQAAGDTAGVLASQPHPARLFVRRLDSFPDLDGLPEMLTPQWFYLNVVLGGIDPATNPNLESPYTEIGLLYRSATANRPIDSIDTQIAVWHSVATGLPGFLSSLNLSRHIRTGSDWIDAVISMLSSYEQRQHPVRELDLAAFAAVLGEQATTLIEGVLWTTAPEWGNEGLIQARGAAAGHTAVDYLNDLRDRFSRRRADGLLHASGLSEDFLARQPLLYQLLDRSLHLAPMGDREEQAVIDALELLATVAPDDLDWLLRETLGIGMHRLDAWRTSLAADRLDRLRRDRPRGLHAGGFGWVQDLKPRKAKRGSDGFVHAPSLAQAATAAILRSGWRAHGSDDPLSPVAVNLTSARVRAATWLLDGVRAGQDLGDLLGYRFERTLHDRKADAKIRPVRAAVLVAAGRPDAEPDQPVDGIALLDLARSGGLGLDEAAVTTPVREAIADLEEAFDAVNDVALVEAVHQLASGNYGRATAMLDSMTGTHSPPEPLAPLTIRDGLSIEHRVLILLDPAAAAPLDRGWVAGVRDRICPALEAWVASVLPPATAVALPGGHRLADLGLSALDAVYLVGDDPARLSPPLETLAKQSTPPNGHPAIPFADFALIAIELRRAFESLRPADARDLRPAGSAGEPDADLTRTMAAAAGVISEFITGAATSTARYGFGEAEAPRRRANVRAVEGTEKRLGVLLGGRLPLLGEFVVDQADFTAPVASAAEADDWFDAMARVRPALGRLFTAGMAAQLSTTDGGLRLAATQLPEPNAPWVATHRPQRPRGNLSLVAVVGPGGPPRPGARVCGLVVDRWSERLPHPYQTTGIAVQHDAPTNRPPQSWLLAMTPQGERWSLQLVLDTLLETLDHAAQRAVGPEDLLDYGRAIPAVFVPGNIANWPAEPPKEGMA